MKFAPGLRYTQLLSQLKSPWPDRCGGFQKSSSNFLASSRYLLNECQCKGAVTSVCWLTEIMVDCKNELVIFMPPKQIPLHLPFSVDTFSVLFLMQQCKRQKSPFMNVWFGGLIWLHVGLQLIATWLMSVGYVQRTDGSRYPNSGREKVKGTAACWESRQMALRIPSSTASGTQQRGIGREAENQRQLTVSLTSSWRKHKLPVPSPSLRAKFELRKWNNRWQHALWTASKKRLCDKKRPKLQLLQQSWRWRLQRQMFTN